ncbi:MAG: hypothetical protein V4532_06055 [Pseudomonadota bacterium]
MGDQTYEWLRAETCQTIESASLTISVGTDARPLAPPLRNSISFECANEVSRIQAANCLQLAAATQALRHPWLNFDGLYRLIVTHDRSSAIQANGHHLECIGQSVEDHLQRSGACAFPTKHGIVVILPLRILAYALEPESETERQYGLTTIWHELAHVHDLTLHYPSKTGQWPPVKDITTGQTRQSWHEYFADRHSHWPGFSADFELQLANQALTKALASRSRPDIATLMTRLASTHGRLAAQGLELDQAAPELADRLNQLRAKTAWTACAAQLDNALADVRAKGRPPDLRWLEVDLKNFQKAFATDRL